MDMQVTQGRAAVMPPDATMRFDDWVGVRNVHELLHRSAVRHEDATAITFLNSDIEAPPRKLSYRALFEGVTRTANALRALGVRRGDVVAYMLPALPETQFVLWGAATAAIALPLNPLLKTEELAGLCRAAGVTVLVALGPVPGTEMWAKAVQLRDMLPSIRALVQVGGDRADGEGVHLLAQLLQAQPARLAFSDTAGSKDVAAYFHTGGTTGAPRLVVHTHGNQVAAAFGAACAIAAAPGDVMMNGLPMFHVASAMFCSLAMFVAGAEVLILSPAGFRNPQVVANFWRIAERFGVTMVGGVPTALSAVAKMDPAGADLRKVRVNISGASLLPRSVAEQMERITGKPLREVYGMTETAGVICVDPASHARVLGSAGLPIPFCRVQARVPEGGPQGGRVCDPGETGVLLVAGPNVTPGYKDPAHNAALFTHDGWLVTGDMGHVDAQGRVFITGRAKDLIIRSGHNIDPAALEESLLRHPAVAEAAAVGMPDAYAGEVPVAYVVLRPGAAATAQELVAFVQPHVEPPAVPRQVFLVPQLPLTAVGKVYKPALREDCAQRHLRELLESEPIAALSVRDEPGRGQVVRIALHDVPQAQESRARIDEALRPYLLGVDWSPTQAASA